MPLFLSGPGRHPLPFLDGRQHASSWLEPRLSEQVTRGSGSLKAPRGLGLGPAPQDTAVPLYLYKHPDLVQLVLTPLKAGQIFTNFGD